MLEPPSDRAGCLDDKKLVELVEGRLCEKVSTAADAHLTACADCLARVTAVVRAQPPRVGGSSSSDSSASIHDTPPPFTSGTAIGRYIVQDLVGVGAMGAVYAAIDPALGRTVALKLVRTRAADDAARQRRTERLVHEART